MKELIKSITCKYGVRGIICVMLLSCFCIVQAHTKEDGRPRVIVLTDGEEDDKASMVRFLLSSNEFKVEAIVNTSSQFHWVGGKGWNALKPVTWVKDYIRLYAKVYKNLLLHDERYPSPEYLTERWKVGNINAVGEDSIRTEGAEFITRILLDKSNPEPIWIQCWGGCNTLARALKIIEEDYPGEMERVAKKMRLFLIWEQDGTYQSYIRPHWEKFRVLTIISDQFDCMAYIWSKVLPDDVKEVFGKAWMRNILNGKGPLCDVYYNNNGAFNAEGDTPAFLHCMRTGLRNMESPDYGGWGGRYVKVRNNVWMDPLPAPDFKRPDGKWGFESSWSKAMEHYKSPDSVAIRTRYFKPIWRWMKAVQNDFAARADWCVKDYASANHPPIVGLRHTKQDISAKAGQKLTLDASGSKDPDGDSLTFSWWCYEEASHYNGSISFNSKGAKAELKVPADARRGDTIHIVCEVSDTGTPRLTRYARIIIHVK